MTHVDVFFISIIVFLIWCITALTIYLPGQIKCETECKPYYFKTLEYFKHETNLNKFGIFCVFTFNLFISPTYYVIVYGKILKSKAWNFIYKLTHVVDEKEKV